MIALTAVSGRGTVAMWGYPLWLFVGLWIVMFARAAFDADRMTRIVAAWAAVFVIFIVVFVANYAVLPFIDHRYRAVLFPGDALGSNPHAAFSRRDRRAARAMSIGTMWDGGNLAHYSPDQPQVLIDGLPAPRAVDRSRRSARQGRRGGVDARRYRASAGAIRRRRCRRRRSARRSTCRCAAAAATVHVGWAVLKPK